MLVRDAAVTEVYQISNLNSKCSLVLSFHLWICMYVNEMMLVFLWENLMPWHVQKVQTLINATEGTQRSRTWEVLLYLMFDASGTSFTAHVFLSHVSPDWKNIYSSHTKFTSTSRNVRWILEWWSVTSDPWLVSFFSSVSHQIEAECP